MPEYQPRLIDKILSEFLGSSPAIAIDGAKGVGKTTTAKQVCQSEFRLDDAGVREFVSASPHIIRDSAPPILLDEWQRLPEIWDTVRRLVDDDGRPGQYLLTGSAYPRAASIHSGAGRIDHLRMRPLSIAERQIGAPIIGISDLLAGGRLDMAGQSDVELADYIDEIARSGFPAINKLSAGDAARRLRGYVQNITEREFSDQGYTVRNPSVLRSWLASYAAAQGSTASYSKILDGATPGQPNKPSEKTTRGYRDALSQLWLIDEVGPWLPIGAHFSNIGKSSKHFLVDPGIAMALLDLDTQSFLQGSLGNVIDTKAKTVLGSFFEALIAQSLHSYAMVNGAELRHFRSSNGVHEVDFVIQKGRRLVALEVKLSASADNLKSSHLDWFEREFADYSVSKCVVTAGAYAYTQKNGTHVIPAALLGA